MVSTKGESHSTRHASKAANETKNSYKKLVPFDYNRVVLEPLPGIPDSDYINASYIDSILKPNAFIAAQGPNEFTISDFWRMVWEHESYVIVMLTKVFDFIRVMCVQYWPTDLDKPEEYGNLEITLLAEEQLANFFIRTVKIKKGEEEREIVQLHYTNWPSHTCPFPSALLEFRRRVQVYMMRYPSTGPVVVHCSDGCGRTGTYLCIEANLELAEEDFAYDVFGYAKKLRAARRGMIETLDHYKFIYDALEEASICGSTWFPVNALSQQLKFKSMKNPVDRMNEYQREYQKICKNSSKLSIGDCAGGHRPENRDKNRDVSIVPRKFKKLKEDKFNLGLDFPNLPYYIDSESSVKLTQSLAILRYLGRKYGLHGNTEQQIIRVEMAEQQLSQLRDNLRPLLYSNVQEFDKLKPAFLSNLQVDLERLDAFLGNNYIAGDGVTYVDFMAYELLDIYGYFTLGQVFKDFKRLGGYRLRVGSLPSLESYLKSPSYTKWPISWPTAAWGGKGPEPQWE
ncbi:hypothetical protein JTE90_029293 [Oedothorax gibbosus]|uniref:Uncharacterized protein n=2 Tax=Oedothorax gibbosus TaxID=931172 RepID=A0AAV6U319_9ARAC|nr:hypothetical protein JTE90_029293 [Oedothorax gibbosus]